MKILVPIDGSSYGENAVAFLASRATLLWDHPEIELLVVLDSFSGRVNQMVGRDSLTRYYEEEAEKCFTGARKYLADKKIEYLETYLVGKAAETIARYAEEKQFDLIVMGSHGRTALQGLFIGSVTNGVLARTKIPLIIVRNKPAPLEDALKVGLAVDGSVYGLAAVKYVIKHKSIFGNGANVTLLNVAGDYTSTVMPDMAGMALPMLSEDEIKELQTKEFSEAVDPLLPALKKAGIQTDCVSLIGNPGDEIANYAKDHNLDLVIMGSHGYGRIKSAVMGSTAMRIAAQGNVPLLLIQA